MTVRLIVRSTVLVTGGVLFAAPCLARALPILFSPPPHYRVLRKLGQKGELGGYYFWGATTFKTGGGGGEAAGASWNRPILKHWLRASRKLGANALLLRPVCRHCIGGFVRYAGEAIRVRGSPCILPFECWSVRQVIVSRRRREAWTLRQKVESRFIDSRYRAFGLSVRTGWPAHTDLGVPIGYMTSTQRSRLHCPSRNPFGHRLSATIPTPAIARIGAGGGKPGQVLIVQVGSEATWMIVHFIRHWRFRMPPVAGTHPVHLLISWHLVALRKGRPVPRGVVCEYPAYPARDWHRGKMVRHLRWPVYALREGGRQVLFAANPAPVNPDFPLAPHF